MDRANIGMDRKYIGKKGFYIASQNDVRILKLLQKLPKSFPTIQLYRYRKRPDLLKLFSTTFQERCESFSSSSRSF